MEEAISKLKYSKAPGYDKISAEMIKNMREVATEFLWKIMNKVYSEEIIFKKGDNKNCNNYRGIYLFRTVLKLYEKILE